MGRAQGQRLGGLRFRGGGLRFRGGAGPDGRAVRSGRRVAPHAGVGMEVEQRRAPGVAVLVQDEQRPLGRRARVLQQDDLLPDQFGVGLVQPAVDADRAGAGDAALEAVAEDPLQVDVGSGIAHVAGELRPAVQRRIAVEAAVRRVVVVAFDPSREPAVEGGEAGAFRRAEQGQEFGSNTAKPAFYLALPAGSYGRAWIKLVPSWAQTTARCLLR